ncbi:TolC family protein [Rickettsia australis]|uniref:RND efflux system, outer membrane protein n=1 Tax=Rickettsia australis (strain Cutlack) TaxID=1105110 RepID=H8K7P1_RICAC|nr:TolC family protein [Rickettsia australis]AFC71284.1 RND efflux system, outer membrane protein [Rickettsia australis str. Cutlack]
MGGNITGPIFDFGKTRTNVQIAASVKKQYVAAYKSVVCTAFGQVMDALSFEQTSSNNLHIWQQNEAALTSIFKLADQCYKRGNIDYLTVLTTKQNILQNEIDWVAIKLLQLSSMVNIFHTLGRESGSTSNVIASDCKPCCMAYLCHSRVGGNDINKQK